MLKKNFRLKTKEDFERVFRTGKPLFFGFLGCKISKNTVGHVRIGFSLSKKHIKNAVTRNRLRRVVASFFQRALSSMGYSPSYDVAFFTVKKPISLNFSSFAREVENVVEYMGV